MIIDCHIQPKYCASKCMVEMPWPTSFYASQGDCHCKPTIHAAAFFGWLSVRARLRNHSRKIPGRNRPNINEDVLIARSPIFPFRRRGDLVRDACCNATSSFAVPDVGRPSLESIQATLESVYLRRYPSRSGDLSEAGSVWLETVERGVLLFRHCSYLACTLYIFIIISFSFFFFRFPFLFLWRPHDNYQIGSCSNEWKFDGLRVSWWNGICGEL